MNDVTHTIWFYNDTALIDITSLNDGVYPEHKLMHFTISKCTVNLKHFLNPKRVYEKGTVEQIVRFMRRNLFAQFSKLIDFNAYSKELLVKSFNLFKA